MESRTEAMLSFLGARFQPHPVRLLESVSQPIEELLRRPELRGERHMGHVNWNEHSESLSFDLSLLVARVMLRVADPTFRLIVLRKPKLDAFVNHLTFVPSDNRWDRASWSPEHFSIVITGCMMNGKSSMSDHIENVRDILTRMV